LFNCKFDIKKTKKHTYKKMKEVFVKVIEKVKYPVKVKLPEIDSASAKGIFLTGFSNTKTSIYIQKD